LAAAMLLFLLGTGCQAPRTLGKPVSHTFAIDFAASSSKTNDTRYCPKKAAVTNPDFQCRRFLFWKKEDCLIAARGDTITFETRAKKGNENAKDFPFSIRFAPFPQGAINATGRTPELPIDLDAPYKTYSFNVYSLDCPVLDPVIIIEN
jgi:hypothetical protein